MRMITCAKLAVAEAVACCAPLHKAHRVLKLHDDSIVGIIMEKANGKNVVKTLQNPDFCNVSSAAVAWWGQVAYPISVVRCELEWQVGS